VEEAPEKLELVWRDRTAAAAPGARAAGFMRTLPWRSQMDLLVRAIEPFMD
jgi:hypothetical protein